MDRLHRSAPRVESLQKFAFGRDICYGMAYLEKQYVRSPLLFKHFIRFMVHLFILAGHSSGSCSAQLFVGQEESCEDH